MEIERITVLWVNVQMEIGETVAVADWLLEIVIDHFDEVTTKIFGRSLKLLWGDLVVAVFNSFESITAGINGRGINVAHIAHGPVFWSTSARVPLCQC